jgi:hypothetical protein
VGAVAGASVGFGHVGLRANEQKVHCAIAVLDSAEQMLAQVRAAGGLRAMSASAMCC